MDFKTALQELKHHNIEYGGKCTYEVRKIAINAMEKQISKIINMNESIKYLDGSCVGWICPGCNTVLFDFGIYDYCPHCGQRLEWRDDNIEAESN